jgi:hypothetical protein
VTAANGQASINLKSLVGKKLVENLLEYLEILNDTTLYSSINLYTETARFYLKMIP